MDNAKLEGLLERVEKASGPDREIDCLVGCIDDLRAHPDEQSWADKMERFGLEHCMNAATSHQNIWRELLPAYTASIDASVALVERVLPQWKWGLHCHNGLIRGYVVENSPLRPMPVIADMATAPLAILTALLKALIARADA